MRNIIQFETAEELVAFMTTISRPRNLSLLFEGDAISFSGDDAENYLLNITVSKDDFLEALCNWNRIEIRLT